MSAPPAESIVRGAAFEGLLVRLLQPTGRFAEELSAAGYDPRAAPRAEYPRRVWLACVEIARRHTYPELPRDEGLRRLGRRFVEALRQTLMGKLLSATLPMLSPAAVMQRLPKAWANTQPQLRLLVRELAPRDWSVTFEDRDLLPHFCVGQLEAVVALTAVRDPRVTLVEQGPDRCVIRVSWGE
jgi:uncharacterized protein (TIGR02265 family)